MQYRQLGNSGLKISLIGLGTMTFGEQNSQAESFQQLDYALDQGINLIDTAEMYPIAPKAQTQGKTEEIIGRYLTERNCRDKIILATKITGRSDYLPWIRDETETRINKKQITHALDLSLKRLQTDYIDLYQIHWPDRKMRVFGGLGYVHFDDDDFLSALETLDILNECIKAGKIRTIGLSNETPWGLSEFLNAAKQNNLPQVVSIQNAYSLVNRTFEQGLSEFSHRENVPLLAYSPLAQGYLSGKYRHGALPQGSRKACFNRMARYETDSAPAAIERYLQLSEQYNMTPAQLALAFVNTRPFVGSNLIGATNLEQLKENIESVDLTLSDDVLEAIEAIHLQSPNPCP